MKSIVLLLLFLPCIIDLSAQNYPFWDFRNTNFLNGQVGVGYTFGNQNHRFYVFSNMRVCVTCALNNYAEFSKDAFQFSKNNEARGYLNIGFRTQKNWRLYGISFTKDPDYKVRGPSWTFVTNLGFGVEYGFLSDQFLAKENLGQNLDTRFFWDSRFRVDLDFISKFNTWYFRKISNTNGVLHLNWAKLDDSYGLAIKSGNDNRIYLKPLNLLFQVNPFDHGETTSFRYSVYLRPTATKYIDPASYEKSFTQTLENELRFNRITFSYSTLIVTDRRKANRATSAGARLGHYNVINHKSVFHNYQSFNLTLEGEYWYLDVTLGKDNLPGGRNTQRSAHQGALHKPYFKRTGLECWPRYLFGWASPKYWNLVAQKKAENKTGFLKEYFSNYRDYWKTYKGVSHSPLFPWEDQAAFYLYPKSFFEIDTRLNLLLTKGN